jgi:hypothetical protein
MDWTPIIQQLIVTGGGVAVVWIKLHSIENKVNGLSDKRADEAKQSGISAGIVLEKDAQQVRSDAHSADERKGP